MKTAMKTWPFFFFILLFFTQSFADESILPLRKVLDAQGRHLLAVPGEARTRGCEARYQRLWQDGELQIDWYYGYLDSEGLVSDRLYSQETRAFLMRPCGRSVRGACGFKMIADHRAEYGPVILAKQLSRQHRIVIRVWYSSLTDWEVTNSVGIGHFSVMNRQQRQKTQSVWEDFVTSLKSTEVVVYSGHSRVGTGPGFSPFNILQSVGGALFKYNQEKVNHALRTAVKKPEILMMSSCESEKYFLKSLHKSSPKSAIAVTQFEQSFGAGEQMVIALIDSLAVGRCAKGLNRALESANGPQDGGMRVFGFDR